MVIGFYFSFRLTKVPLGLTMDEASIGYNAVLLSRNLRDETGRYLPFFPLTINGKDWKQPVTVYTTAVFFKLFGPSVYNLRLVSVIVATVSFGLIVIFGYMLMGKWGGLMAGLFFVTTPIILIHSHLAQENIMPIPFTLLWLIGIYLYSKKYSPKYLILSGISLGIGLYSYKGMRAIVPAWTIITVLFIFLSNLSKINKSEILKAFKYCLCFIGGIFPFVAIIPWLNIHYAGAVYEENSISIGSFYNYIYAYLSSFDLSALFIKGDTLIQHSTGIHGVFLVSTLPLFLFGLVTLTKKDKYWLFLLAAFLITPILFGTVGSVYRFSRLLVFVPFFVAFTSLGVITIFRSKLGRYLLLLNLVFVIINFYDFVKYYWFSYPKIEQSNYLTNREESFVELNNISYKQNLKPYIFIDDIISEGEAGKFFESAYFPKGLGRWKPGEVLPANSVLMSSLGIQPNLIIINRMTEGKYNYLLKK